MTQEALKLALECAKRCEAIDGMYSWSATITAIKEALAQEQEPVAKYSDIVSDGGLDPRTTTPPQGIYYTPPQRKYRRGDRLICLETEEYCVIHISGTDRQWVKFPDSHVGVYTNEQVAELFELLPKETEQTAQVPVTDNTYGYAKSLAEAIFIRHFARDEHYASGRIVWRVNDTVIGILTQIDNMVADMVRRTEQPEQEPVAVVDVHEFYANCVRDFANMRGLSLDNAKVLDWNTTPPQRKPLPPQSPCEMTQAEGKMFKLGWLECEAAHGIKE